MENLTKKVSPSTIQTELESVLKLLASIEEKLFISEPKIEQQVQDFPSEKILILRNDITNIAEKLRKIDNTIDFIGK